MSADRPLTTPQRAWIAVFAASMLLLAIVAVFTLRDAGVTAPSPSATGGPTSTVAATATAALPSASAVASPSASSVTVLDDRFGFVLVSGTAKVTLRSESGGPPIGAKSGFRAELEGIHFAPSPSGNQLAYWHTAVDGGPPHVLRILRVGEDQEQTIIMLPTSQRGGSIVWSDDSSGLLYATQSAESVGGVGGGPRSSSLESWDLRATQANGTAYGMLTAGGVYVPIAWSKGAGIVAAGETGEGGFMSAYVTFKTATLPPGASPQTRVPPNERITMGSVHASSDARFVLGVSLDTQAVRWWPIADYAAGRIIGTGAAIASAAWRPATSSFAYVAGDTLVLYDVVAGSTTASATGVRGGNVRTFRPGGSAAVLFAQNGTTVVAIGTGRSAPVQAQGAIGPWVRFAPN